MNIRARQTVLNKQTGDYFLLYYPVAEGSVFHVNKQFLITDLSAVDQFECSVDFYSADFIFNIDHENSSPST